MSIPEGQFSGPDEPYETGEGTSRHVAKLPQWRVLLHDDEVHEKQYVIDALDKSLPISKAAATQRVINAHRDGTTILLITHLELAELYCLQLSKQNLIVTLERDA